MIGTDNSLSRCPDKRGLDKGGSILVVKLLIVVVIIFTLNIRGSYASKFPAIGDVIN